MSQDLRSALSSVIVSALAPFRRAHAIQTTHEIGTREIDELEREAREPPALTALVHVITDAVAQARAQRPESTAEKASVSVSVSAPDGVSVDESVSESITRDAAAAGDDAGNVSDSDVLAAERDSPAVDDPATVSEPYHSRGVRGTKHRTVGVSGERAVRAANDVDASDNERHEDADGDSDGGDGDGDREGIHSAIVASNATRPTADQPGTSGNHFLTRAAVTSGVATAAAAASDDNERDNESEMSSGAAQPRCVSDDRLQTLGERNLFRLNCVFCLACPPSIFGYIFTILS